jgi:hypothetical protein
MFSFDKPTPVTLAHVNLREERHGDESAPAIDVKFVRTHGNSQLALLHPDLCKSLYHRADATDAQADITGVEPVAPNLRFPKLQPFAWDLEMTGCSVVIDYGVGDALSNVELRDCKVNGFRVDCSEGGTTAITFRVQTSNFPAGALDKLAGKLGQETAITLWAPEVKADPVQTELDTTPPAPAKKRGRAANERTPEDALAATQP